MIARLNDGGNKTSFSCSGHILSEKAYIDSDSKRILCVMEKLPHPGYFKKLSLKNAQFEIGYITLIGVYPELCKKIDCNQKQFRFTFLKLPKIILNKYLWKKNFIRKNITQKDFFEKLGSSAEPYFWAEKYCVLNIKNLFKKQSFFPVKYTIIRFAYQQTVEAQLKAIETLEKLIRF